MLQTMAMFFIAFMCSAVITSSLPVVVTKMSQRCDRLFHRHDFIAFHRRLQRADRVDFGDHHAGAAVAQRIRRALADIAEPGDAGDLAGQHHVGRPADRVDQRFLAAIEVVELRLGHAVVHVDRRERQLALLGEAVEPVDAGGRLFRNALDVLDRLR